MLQFFARTGFAAAVLLGSVLVHVGLLGVIVLAERRSLGPSETQTIDVELVRQEELPEPPKLEPPKPEPPKPEPPKPELKAVEKKPADQLPTPAPAPAAQASLPPPPPPPPSAPSQEKVAKTEPRDPQEPAPKPEGPSGGPPSESKSRLTPEEIAALRAQIQKCWQLPVGIPGVMGLDVIIRVSFGAKGQLAGEPVLLKAPASERGPLLVGIAMRALKDCMPYKMPPAKYADWKVLDLRFVATGMTGLGVAPKLPPQVKQ